MATRKNSYRTERLQIMLDQNELALLDEWRFTNHMPSRAAAIRELLRRGLVSHDVKPRHGNKSTDYKVDGD